MSGAAIPEGWSRKLLGDIARLYQPTTISARAMTQFGYPVYGANGLVGFYPEFNHETPQVMITCRGSTCGVVNRSSGKCWITGNAMVANIDANPTVASDFFYFLIAGQDFSECITGTGQPQIVRGPLCQFSLMFPDSIHEQQAIAAALSDADRVVAGLERVIAKKRLIKQGAMQELLAARRRHPGFSGEWEVKRFAQIARIRNAKVQTLGNPVAQNCIELEQVEHETGRILFWVDATIRSTVKYQFEVDDVLFGRLRPYLRKFYRANSQGVCSTEIWPLMTQGIESSFLYQVVQSDGFIAAACEAYGTHMPRADWGKLATYEVQVPVEPKEQAAIGEALSDMEKEIQTLESRLTKARAVKEGMMQNLLTGRVRLV